MFNLTLVIIIMTGIISYQAFNNYSMKEQLLFHPVSIRKSGQFYRFFTHGFIHGNWGHLFINMFVLYQFGRFSESFFDFLFGTIPAIY